MPKDDPHDTGVSQPKRRAPHTISLGASEPPTESGSTAATTGPATAADWEVISSRTLGSLAGTITLRPGDVRHAYAEGSTSPILRAELVVAGRGPIPICLYNSEDEYLIGRDRSLCHVVVSDPRVSRAHLTIHVEGGKPVLSDRNSTNGTFVNGNRVTGTQELRFGDRIKFGRTEVEFRVL